MNHSIDDLNSVITIEGLKWVARWRINNGRVDSFVVPFPTTHPVNIVYHGEEAFRYGQYGVHLGQQDTLTFLGDETQTIRARFIDCRTNSPTFRVALDVSFIPSSGRTLIIPPGIAHTFDGLENVFTLNSYTLLLPPIDELSSGSAAWSPANDIINLPEDIAPGSVPGYTPMTEEASDLVYHRIGEFQASNLKTHRFQHAETREFILDDGRAVNLRIKERLEDKEAIALPSSKIRGVEFQELPSIKTGSESRIVPLTRKSPMYVVEHGNERYDFNSYGLHLGQEDHLVFLGNSKQLITLKLVDMREGSDTLFVEDEMTFYPAPDRELVIPCGVAHALTNMQNIYTINRPVLYLDEGKTYLPGHDVIDWPICDTQYLSYKTNPIPADEAFYLDIVKKQNELLKTPPTRSTPKSIVIYDEDAAKFVKVIIKDKTVA